LRFEGEYKGCDSEEATPTEPALLPIATSNFKPPTSNPEPRTSNLVRVLPAADK
jgi:hypothetical protein